LDWNWLACEKNPINHMKCCNLLYFCIKISLAFFFDSLLNLSPFETYQRAFHLWCQKWPIPCSV
jgi:hypothetical protein